MKRKRKEDMFAVELEKNQGMLCVETKKVSCAFNLKPTQRVQCRESKK